MRRSPILLAAALGLLSGCENIDLTSRPRTPSSALYDPQLRSISAPALRASEAVATETPLPPAPSRSNGIGRTAAEEIRYDRNGRAILTHVARTPIIDIRGNSKALSDETRDDASGAE